MKKFLLAAFLFSSTFCFGQLHGGFRYGFSYGYRPYHYGFYNPYYGATWINPYFTYAAPVVRPAPSKLDKQVATIEHDADQKIASVRMDHGLSGKERRTEIRDIHAQEHLAIADAKRNYYKN